MKKYYIYLCLTLSLILSPHLFASELKSDEEILYFRSSAAWDADAKQWQLPIHGWVFEAESDSLWRQGAMELLKLRLGLSSKSNHSQHLKTRGWPFIVDNEGGKQISVQFSGSRVQLSPSEANGHFYGETSLPGSGMFQPEFNNWVRLETVMPEGDERHFGVVVQLVGTQGLSIISDIDDTIKHSHVLDHEELLKNTFLRDFKAVPDMAELYQHWDNQDAVFHYVTGSPWQLYPALRDFTDSNGFPHGSFAMRNFRIKDSSLLDFLGSSYDYKLATIDALLTRYSQREFILVGDSGEKDPEVYGEIARRHPKQVSAIYIHNVTAEEQNSERLNNAFRSLPETTWKLFTDGYELEKRLANL